MVVLDSIAMVVVPLMMVVDPLLVVVDKIYTKIVCYIIVVFLCVFVCMCISYAYMSDLYLMHKQYLYYVRGCIQQIYNPSLRSEEVCY